jgi:hypothetical protein
MLFASIAFYGFFLRKLNTIERTSFGISAILVLLYLIMHVSYLLPISLGLGALGILWILIGRFRIAPDKVKRAEKLAG